MKNSQNIGLIVGKFLPLHNGHIYFINKALESVDKLVVVVDENHEADSLLITKANLKYPSLEVRTKWLMDIFKDNQRVIILSLSEINIPLPPFGWKQWSDLLKNIVKPFGITKIFTSDISYKENYEKYLPEWEHTFFDNDRKATNGISSTQVRSDIKKYWDQIPGVVKEFYGDNY